MEFSDVFIRLAQKLFISYYTSTKSPTLTYNLLFNKNNVYNKIFTIETEKDNTFEIPIFNKYLVEYILSNKIKPVDGLNKDIIFKFPIYQNSNIENCASSTTLLNKMLSTDNNKVLTLCIYKDEYEYYGGNGIILDKEFNILLLSVLKAEINKHDDIFKLVYKKPILYVSPLIFSEPKDPLNKIIINKIIPYYVNNVTPYMNHYIASNIKRLENNCRKADIIIKDCNNYITSPEPPKVSEDINEELNTFIVDNIKDIENLF